MKPLLWCKENIWQKNSVIKNCRLLSSLFSLLPPVSAYHK